MGTRRHTVRPTAFAKPSIRRQRQLAKLRDLLDRERVELRRWMDRFCSAFCVVVKHEKAIVRLERRIARKESA